MVTPNAVQCEYDIPVVGEVAASTILALVQAAPVDFTPLEKYGLILRSDVTVLDVATVKRTLVAQFKPNTAATGTLTLVPGDDAKGAPVDHLTLTGSGDGYGGATIVQFFESDGTLITPASGPFIPQASAQMGVSAIIVETGGTGYSGATVAAFVGGQLAPGGTPAVAGAVSVDGGGHVTAVAVTSAGGPYNVPPRVVITDTGGGTGATAASTLKVTGLTLVTPGKDLPLQTTLGFLPPFFQQAPADDTKKATLRGWMTKIIAIAARTPVIPIDPILIV